MYYSIELLFLGLVDSGIDPAEEIAVQAEPSLDEPQISHVTELSENSQKPEIEEHKMPNVEISSPQVELLETAPTAVDESSLSETPVTPLLNIDTSLSSVSKY